MKVNYPPNWAKMSQAEQGDWFINEISISLNRILKLNIFTISVAGLAFVISVFALLANN